MEERQAVRFRDRRADGRAQVRGRVVRQQEVRLRRDHVQGRHQGGGKVQEQRAGDVAEEKTLVPHPVGQAQGTDRGRRERGAQGVENRAAKGRHRDFPVSPAERHYIALMGEGRGGANSTLGAELVKDVIAKLFIVIDTI